MNIKGTVVIILTFLISMSAIASWAMASFEHLNRMEENERKKY